MLTDVPQGSVLGPLLLNIYRNDLFNVVEHTDIYIFADSTTLHCSSTDMNEVMQSCEQISAKLLGIIIDSSLKFDDHVKKICKIPFQKITAVSQMSNFMSQK